jgi:type I restriction enzyme M protein
MARGRPKSRQPADSEKPTGNGANVGYETQLWQMADALRGSMDAAEYKHVVLGLIFLKYISDAFEERHAYLSRAVDDPDDEYFLPARTRNRTGAVAQLIEDPDEYRAQNIFWVPHEARWPHIKAQARQSTIGRLVDDAMAGIERDNPVLKGVLPKDYARPALDKPRLGQLIDLISNQNRRSGEPRQGRARARLRVFPVAVRERRRQEGRRVLHPALRREAPGGDARTLQGPGL